MVRHLQQLKVYTTENKEVENHIQILLRLLAIQSEENRTSQDFDSGIRILLHSQAIQKLIQRWTINPMEQIQHLLKNSGNTNQPEQPNSKAQQADVLPISAQEMRRLEYDLLKNMVSTKGNPLTFSLPVKSQDTCWNYTLPQDLKNLEIFIGRCGKCNCYHEYPRCDQCKAICRQAGKCLMCNYDKEKEDFYNGYCGNCFQRHELPNCVECQHY